ncbi:hypothetical protein [Oceanobacillus sp. CAU 1775]
MINIEDPYQIPRIKPSGKAGGTVAIQLKDENDAANASKIIYEHSENEYIIDLE